MKLITLLMTVFFTFSAFAQAPAPVPDVPATNETSKSNEIKGTIVPPTKKQLKSIKTPKKTKEKKSH